MNFLRRLWLLRQFLRRNGGMKGVAKLAQASPKYLALYQRLMADNRVPASAKAVLVGAGIFAVSPLNLPNFIPLVGAIDDIGIILIANEYFLKKVPASVLREHRAAVGLDSSMP